MVVIGWFELQLWMDRLVKLSDKYLASELVENRSFLNQSQSMEMQFLWLKHLQH